MSKLGIELAASALSCLQETRGRLLHGDKQDIQLGQLLDDAKDAIKDRFAKVVGEGSGHYRPPRRRRPKG